MFNEISFVIKLFLLFVFLDFKLFFFSFAYICLQITFFISNRVSLAVFHLSVHSEIQTVDDDQNYI